MATRVRVAWRRLGSSEPVKIGAVPVLVAVVALFFVFPWLPEPSPAGAALERYSPEHDGGSLLIKSYDANGRPISTQSQNLATIPDLRAFTERARPSGPSSKKPTVPLQTWNTPRSWSHAGGR